MPDSRLIPEPTIFILYGGTGDLAHRLVLPGLFQLAIAGLLPEDWRLIADGRGDMTDEEFQEGVRYSLEEFGPKPHEGPWEEFGRACASLVVASARRSPEGSSKSWRRRRRRWEEHPNGSITWQFLPPPLDP